MRFQLLTLATLFCSTMGCGVLSKSSDDEEDDEEWGDEGGWDSDGGSNWGSGGGSAGGSTSGGAATSAETGGEETGGEETGGAEGGDDSSSSSTSCQFGSDICIETTADDPWAWCDTEGGTSNDSACDADYTAWCEIPAQEWDTYADAATAYYYNDADFSTACADNGGAYRTTDAEGEDTAVDWGAEGGEETGEDWGGDDDWADEGSDDAGADDSSWGDEGGEETGTDWGGEETGAEETGGEDYCSGEYIGDSIGWFDSSTSSYSDDWSGGCDSGGGRDIAYRWSPPYSGTWEISIGYSDFDPVLRLFRIYEEEYCGDEMECDRGYEGDYYSARITDYLYSYRQYYIVVDGYNSSDRGYFEMRIRNMDGEADGAADGAADAGWGDDEEGGL